jgi:RnfABCDGE-type electron transport complex B subunit
MVPWMVMILAAGTMLVLAMFMAYVLGWANKTWHVQVDPKVEQINEALPGANCGGCGYVGCSEYAEAVAAGEAPPDRCPVGGSSCAAAVASILGIELGESFPYRAVVHCGAHSEDKLKKTAYKGEQTCAAANLVSGVQGCTYGCLGLGDCEAACPFDAIHVIDGLATVDYHKCTGCRKCEAACPRHIISMVPFKTERMVVVACSNSDKAKDVKAVCKVGCIGCGICAKLSDLFHMEEGLAKIDYAKYEPEKEESYEAAVAKCPMKRIVYMGKPSAKDLEKLANEKAPAQAEPHFETTVDKTEWHG